MEYAVGQKVLVTGGYDMDPAWLAGGHGYAGTIVEIVDSRALVELDDEIELHARREPWMDFGDGSDLAPIPRQVVRGRWLALMLGYVGARWEDPIQRVHVGLCAQRPKLATTLQGGLVGAGIGAWVESHATMRHASASVPGRLQNQAKRSLDPGCLVANPAVSAGAVRLLLLRRRRSVAARMGAAALPEQIWSHGRVKDGRVELEVAPRRYQDANSPLGSFIAR